MMLLWMVHSHSYQSKELAMKSTNKIAIAVIGLAMAASPLTYAQTASSTEHSHDHSMPVGQSDAKKPVKSRGSDQGKCADQLSMSHCNDHGKMSDEQHQKMMQKHMDGHQNMMKHQMDDQQRVQKS